MFLKKICVYIDVLFVCGLHGSDLFTFLEFLAATRDSAVLRYKEKKKSRRFDKMTRYASCEESADSRKHVKGRL